MGKESRRLNLQTILLGKICEVRVFRILKHDAPLCEADGRSRNLDRADSSQSVVNPQLAAVKPRRRICHVDLPGAIEELPAGDANRSGKHRMRAGSGLPANVEAIPAAVQGSKDKRMLQPVDAVLKLYLDVMTGVRQPHRPLRPLYCAKGRLQCPGSAIVAL